MRPLGAALSHRLKELGVEVIFGIPGVHNVEMYRGIEESGITHVLARHEGGAGFMADGYARASGRPGVAYVITGPGVTNIMTAMGQAQSDSVPVLVVASCLGPEDAGQGRGRLHEMNDQLAAAASVAARADMAVDAAGLWRLVDATFTEFGLGAREVRYLQVPIETLGRRAEEPPPLPMPALAARHADPAAVAQVACLLAAARRPLLILGGGAAGAGAAACRLAEASGAAVFMTYAGKGLMPPDHPQSLGSYLGRPESAEAIGSADLVVAVGTRLSEVDLWRDGLGRRAPLVRIDRDPRVLSDHHGAETRILADAPAFLEALAGRIAAPARGWSPAEIAGLRQRWRVETGAERPHVLPVIDALRAVLPEATMFYSDMTQFAYVANEVWDMPHPGHWHHPYGFGTLGYALPAAIGGKIARGAAPVVAIAGDYGFHYTMQELGVAVELGLSLPILLWDNGKLKEIEESMVRSQIAPQAVVARNPDFCALARAFGAEAARPRTLADLQAEVTRALARQGPTLIHMSPALDPEFSSSS